MAVVEKISFCNICEAQCGIVATVEDGRLTKVRPDPDAPLSKGFACPKGIALPQIGADPDRVAEPLRRTPSGDYEPVGWTEALDDIARRLKAIIDRDGPQSVGTYGGNPTAFNYGAFFWLQGLCAALGTKHNYTAASVDVGNYWAVGAMLYGHPLMNPIPDLDHTDFLLIVGSNPLVSHASMVTAPRPRDHFMGITARGGRVVVLDPRRTETAAAFEHIAIRPDEDALLLASLLAVIFAEGLQDTSALEAQTDDGGRFLRELVCELTPEASAERTGVPADVARALARDFAGARSAVTHGRCGASLGSASTLVKYLLDALSIATGNFDSRGGLVFGQPFIDVEDISHKLGLATYGSWKSRVDGFPELLGTAPAATMAREITTPGDGQLKALIVTSGNPAISFPGSGDVRGALAQLELLVSIDLYRNETGSLADYVLPGVTGMERDQIPWYISGHTIVPFALWAPKVVDPPPGCREEWWIIDQIARRLGLVPSPAAAVRALGKLGVRLKPRTAFDLFLRIGPNGDLFGLRRRGWSRRKAWRNPRGVKLAEQLPTGVLAKKLFTKDRKVHLAQPVMRTELERVLARGASEGLPLRLVSLRELRSHNSWLHNIPKLMAGDRRQRLRVHPHDAAAAGIADGDRVAVRTATGRVEVEAEVSDEMMPGTIALPQGWGHSGGWETANAAGGANYNFLTSGEAAEQDQPSGNGRCNGVDAALEPLPAVSEASAAAASAA